MPLLLMRLSALALAATFAWAGLAKLVILSRWREALDRYHFPTSVKRAATVGVPATELAVAGLLLAGATRAGAALSVALLSTFCLALIREREIQGRVLPCGCFGRTRERDYGVMLARNALLGALAAVILIGRRDLLPLEGIAAPTLGEVLPVVLAIAGIGMIGWLARAALTFDRRSRNP